MRSPRFRTKDVSTCMGSPTARGSSPVSQLRRKDVAFSSAERDRHLGIRPVSQLNIQPVVSPVNASRRPSRDAAHHSGPGWLARPFPRGRLAPPILCQLSWRTLHRVKRGCRVLCRACRRSARKQTYRDPPATSPKCQKPSFTLHVCRIELCGSMASFRGILISELLTKIGRGMAGGYCGLAG